MEKILHNPHQGLYPALDYAHALELRRPERLLYVSGTMGLDAEGRAADSLEAQLALIWANIRRILAAAGMSLDDVVRVTSYLREPDYALANQEARLAALGGRRVPTTAIVARTLRPDWLVEVEVIAAA